MRPPCNISLNQNFPHTCDESLVGALEVQRFVKVVVVVTRPVAVLPGRFVVSTSKGPDAISFAGPVHTVNGCDGLAFTRKQEIRRFVTERNT